MTNYLNELNPNQQHAVEHIDGPLMVVAGAGSGKTRVLTYRIAHLINNGIDSFNILALTFTNKAANEMKERINSILNNSESHNLWMGTFHSVFAKILRFESQKINFSNNFTIYDTSDSKNLIKGIIKELNLDKDIYKVNTVFNRISQLKNSLISHENYKNNVELKLYDEQRKLVEMGKIYSLYQKRLISYDSMDFDDLLFNTYKLFNNFPEVLNKYQNKFKYILVDEYQDTNHVQYMIIKRLAAMNENICVVGDDAQSIYSFRGANIQNILNFKNDYPDLKIISLEKNYRSTKNIVEASNSIIKNNINQIKKTIYTENEEGDPIHLQKTTNDNEESFFVAKSIIENQSKHKLNFKKFAVLYRTNAQSRTLEEAFRKNNIPYKIYGGLSFYQRKEVKDLLAYFRLTINLKDNESLRRIINYPSRGIGNTTLQKLTIQANNNELSIFESINKLEIKLNSGTLNKLNNFKTMINSFKSELNINAYDLALRIANLSGILFELKQDKTPEGISRYENIQELLNAIKDFSEKNPEPTLTNFMSDIALITDKDDNNDKENNVSLMTIHAAKGLEFPFVYVVGLEENLFPSQMSMFSREDLEEERRLFYVAITRAMKFLQLSFATSRYRWGQLIDCEASRFVEEIDKKFLLFKTQPINKLKVNFKKNKKPFSNNSQSFIPNKLTKISKINNSTNNNSLLKSGMEVEHIKFGKGKILSIEGINGNKTATIFFQNIGQKKLLLKFAKLKVI